MKKIILLLILLLIPCKSYATDWVSEASCLFAYLYEADGDPTIDSCGNSNGDYINTPTHATASPAGAFSTGYFDLDTGDGFDGSDQTVESTALSGVSWVYIDAFGGDEAGIIVKFNSGADNLKSFVFRIEQDGDLTFISHSTGSTQSVCRSDDAGNRVTTGGWHHVAFTWDGNVDTGDGAGGDEVVLYVDGTAVSAYSATANENSVVAIQNTTTPITVGRWEDQVDDMDGKLDETALFNVELTSEQIADIIANGLDQGVASRRIYVIK